MTSPVKFWVSAQPPTYLLTLGGARKVILTFISNPAGGEVDLNPAVGVEVASGFDGCISDISLGGGSGDSGAIGDLASAVVLASNVAECIEEEQGCEGDK